MVYKSNFEAQFLILKIQLRPMYHINIPCEWLQAPYMAGVAQTAPLPGGEVVPVEC